MAIEDRILLELLSEEMRPSLSEEAFEELTGEAAELCASERAAAADVAGKMSAVPQGTYQYEELKEELDRLERRERLLADAAERASRVRRAFFADGVFAALAREEETDSFLKETEAVFRDACRIAEEAASVSSGTASVTQADPHIFEDLSGRLKDGAAWGKELHEVCCLAAGRLSKAAGEAEGADAGTVPGEAPEEILARMKSSCERGLTRLAGAGSVMILAGWRPEEEDREEIPAEEARPASEDLSGNDKNPEGEAWAETAFADPEQARELGAYLASLRDRSGALPEKERQLLEAAVRYCGRAAAPSRKAEERQDEPDTVFFDERTETTPQPGLSFGEKENEAGAAKEPPVSPAASPAGMNGAEDLPGGTDTSGGRKEMDVSPGGGAAARLLTCSEEEYNEALRALKELPGAPDYQEASEVFAVLLPAAAYLSAGRDEMKAKKLAALSSELLSEAEAMEQKSYLNDNVRRKQFARKAVKDFRKLRDFFLSEPSEEPETGAEETDGECVPAEEAGRRFLALMLHLMVLPAADGYTEEETRKQVAEWIGQSDGS